jgi:hypothetical protein
MTAVRTRTDTAHPTASIAAAVGGGGASAHISVFGDTPEYTATAPAVNKLSDAGQSLGSSP